MAGGTRFVWVTMEAMVETIEWIEDGSGGRVVMIDQRRLPRQQVFVTCRTLAATRPTAVNLFSEQEQLRHTSDAASAYPHALAKTEQMLPA